MAAKIIIIKMMLLLNMGKTESKNRATGFARKRIHYDSFSYQKVTLFQN